jgi:hypothetical protein
MTSAGPEWELLAVEPLAEELSVVQPATSAAPATTTTADREVAISQLIIGLSYLLGADRQAPQFQKCFNVLYQCKLIDTGKFHARHSASQNYGLATGVVASG